MGPVMLDGGMPDRQAVNHRSVRGCVFGAGGWREDCGFGCAGAGRGARRDFAGHVVFVHEDIYARSLDHIFREIG